MEEPYEILPDVAEEQVVPQKRASRRDVTSERSAGESRKLQDQPAIFFKPGLSRRFSREPSLDRDNTATPEPDDVKHDPVYDVIPANDIIITVEKEEVVSDERPVEKEATSVVDVGSREKVGGRDVRAVGIGEYSARKFELARRQSSPMMLPT